MKQISIFDVAEQERITEKVQAYKPMADTLQEAAPCALCGVKPVIYNRICGKKCCGSTDPTAG